MFIVFIALALCLVSSITSFTLGNTVRANLGFVKAYNSTLVLILQVISFFAIPVYLLLSYFSWWQAILLYILAIFLSKYVSKIIAWYLMKKSQAHLIVICGMLVGVLSSFFVKGKTYDDGFYCAKVEYYNPNTERERTYHLTVEVQDNKIIQIAFPNGGWLDEDHFDAPEIGSNGKAVISDDRDYEYTVSNLQEGECEDF